MNEKVLFMTGLSEKYFLLNSTNQVNGYRILRALLDDGGHCMLHQPQQLRVPGDERRVAAVAEQAFAEALCGVERAFDAVATFDPIQHVEALRAHPDDRRSPEERCALWRLAGYWRRLAWIAAGSAVRSPTGEGAEVRQSAEP